MTAFASLRRFAPAPGRPGLFSRIMHMSDVARQRHHLAALTDAQLRDIGLSREDALSEARRPVWDAPAHWLR